MTPQLASLTSQIAARLSAEVETDTDSFTQATNQVPSSVKIPSGPTPEKPEAVANQDGNVPAQHDRSNSSSAGSSSVGADGRKGDGVEREHVKKGDRAGGIVHEQHTNGHVNGHANGQMNGNVLDKKDHDNETRPGAKEGRPDVHLPDTHNSLDSVSHPPDDLSPSRDGADEKEEDRAKDFSANTYSLKFRSLAGGGKGVRMESYMSLKQNGRDKKLDLQPPTTEEQGDSDLQEGNEEQLEERKQAQHGQAKNGMLTSSDIPKVGQSAEPTSPQVVRKDFVYSPNSLTPSDGPTGIDQEELDTLPPLHPASAPFNQHNSFRTADPVLTSAIHVPHPSRSYSMPVSHTSNPFDRSPSTQFHQRPPARNAPASQFEGSNASAASRWGTLRQRLQLSKKEKDKQNGRSEEDKAGISLTDELMMGNLGVLILKLAIETDEKGRKRVPVFLHHIRFKVSDSIGGSGNHPVFRVECEYGNGAVKWVIYRSLRDFLSLHAHYKASSLTRNVPGRNKGTKGTVELPEFPRSSIPYFRNKRKASSGPKEKEDESTTPVYPSSQMPNHQGAYHTPDGPSRMNSEVASFKHLRKKFRPKSEDSHSRAGFVENQRTALENYLIGVVHAVMYRPESNHLIRFLELSALSLSLAPNGGCQGKSGYLRVLSANVSSKKDRPVLAPLAWKRARKFRWWIVRESYLIAVDEPDQLEVFDVFLFDQDFAIERPNRVLRKGISKLENKFGDDKHDGASITEMNAEQTEESRLAAMEGDLHGIDKATLGSMNEDSAGNVSNHTFYINNSQTRLKLVAKAVRQMQQFIASLEKMAAESIWAGRNRFDSFAPIRLNVSAQWLVDGRDYLWNVSRALLNAKKCVYIHDWWLSPELYMRRPAQAKYRLDNIMKKKAEEGVKFYIIVYNEVSNKTTPTDSFYTKKSLRGLHPNIFIQRSPSHFATGTFYWSHHEKMCVIDEKIAFMGGVDLCFGRWDTPQHSLVDDDFDPNVVEGEDGPVWPGKDYSNPRVLDFHTLNKPFDDIYDRQKVPRMPWHDVAMQMEGQPARDLCRHFIQRWNHLLRIKNHSLAMPFLIPAPDFTVAELEKEQLTGTCEIQVCRSCGPWSMGTSNRIEHSILNAYLKGNFFITSTVVDGIAIENQIGEALVNRIIQAHEEGTAWRACIVIPLLPGYTYPIDSDAASSVRLIVECQNKSICRGPNSIFGRLRQEGIDPEDYISFFSLRGWGKFKDGSLTTEQVYIHGKVGPSLPSVCYCSANINERSMRGDRDSELASVIRDTDMMDSTMGGKPYKVGRFAHTLRVRLMREHLGVDVDAMAEDDLMARNPVVPEKEIQVWDPSEEQQSTGEGQHGTIISNRTVKDRFMMHASSVAHTIAHSQSQAINRAARKVADTITRSTHEVAMPDDDIEIFRLDDGRLAKGFVSSVVPTMEERRLAEHGLIDGPLRRDEIQGKVGDIADAVFDASGNRMDQGKDAVSSQAALDKVEPRVAETLTAEEGSKMKRQARDPLPVVGPGGILYHLEGEDDIRMEDNAKLGGKEPISSRRRNNKTSNHPWSMPLPTPHVDPEGFRDPLDDKFWKDTWTSVAVHNTEIFRKVFRCIPDDLVTSWTHYRENSAYAEKFNRPPTHGAGGGGSGGGVVGAGQNGSKGDDSSPSGEASKAEKIEGHLGVGDHESEDISKLTSGQSEPWTRWEQERMEDLLGEVRGHLVVFPTRFLEIEDLGNNFLFNSDKLLPLPIYD
ncbi:Phospholipase D1 [Phaffia rhodozyma]|uniref:Phospholipase n=1 Tax=Phaffia rhodozyma TaxID=264483 RepID=A0A0F7SX15_PHARH|nr:Phospholipase D1 [Phaffia rhodozyma]